MFSHRICYIRSADPKCKPILDRRYLSHPLVLEVLAVLARQTRYVETIVKTTLLVSLQEPSGPLPNGK